MLATNIAALVVVKKGGLDPQSLQQMYNTWVFLKVVAINGFLPITFTLTNLYLVGLDSWYMIIISGLTVASSVCTFAAVGRFNPSSSEMANLAAIASSGGPQECDYRQPGVYCYRSLGDSSGDTSYYISTSYSSSTVDSDAAAILAFCLTVMILVLGHRSKVQILALTKFPRHIVLAVLFSFVLFLQTLSDHLGLLRTTKLVFWEIQKAISTSMNCISKHLTEISKSSLLAPVLVRFSSFAIQWKRSRIWQLVKRGAQHHYSRLLEHFKTVGWKGSAELAFKFGIGACFSLLYVNFFVMFLRDLAWFSSNKVYNKTWNFGQVVAITVWAPPICEFIHLEIRESDPSVPHRSKVCTDLSSGGIQRGFDHRLLPPYRVSKGDSFDNKQEPPSTLDEIRVNGYGDNDLSNENNSRVASTSRRLEEGKEMRDICPKQNDDYYDTDDELDDDPIEGPTAIVPLRHEREGEGDREWLLPGPRLTVRASTFPRIPYERMVSQ
ncbi:MAG: hypothetical protein Q9219_002155 [cf. Caloplaca sp. 3 TL-2023]